jgi:AcrR family transcriptional regulator
MQNSEGISLEKFSNLPIEKQNRIIDAALTVFGACGYRKASINDIAAAAGVSKAIIFHYFGTKKALYLYLVDLCSGIMMKELDKKFDRTVTDFFDRILMSADIEISVMKRHPAIPAFLARMYFEPDDEVKSEIAEMLAKGEAYRHQIALEGIESAKFKSGIDPNLVMKMLTWMADGFAHQMSDGKDLDPEAVRNDFYECMSLLKTHFYREEYIPHREGE